MLAYVTGAAGFVGSHLTDRLLSEGWNVVGIDNLTTGAERNLTAANADARFHFVRADVSQPWGWATRAGAQQPDVVLHFASPASPPRYEQLALETMEVNSLGTIHAVACARAAGAPLLFASTSEVYGDPVEHPQRESYWGNVNPIGIRACYDESKRFAEAYITTAVRKGGLDGRVVRIFNAYGPRMAADDGRVIPNFCVAALAGEPLTVYGSGSHTRTFCYVDDLVDAIVRFATRPGLRGRVINVGGTGEHTMRELAATTARLAGVALRTERRPLPQDDPVRRAPDLTLAGELLGWEARTDLETGLRRTLDYFRSALTSAGHRAEDRRA